MAMNTMKFPLVVLVQQELANVTAGESSMSHVIGAPKEVAKISPSIIVFVPKESETNTVDAP